MISRILIPLDGSDLAKELLPLVEDLAHCLKAEVYFIQVVALPTPIETLPLLFTPEFLSEEIEAESKAAESYLSSLAKEWRSKGIDASWQVVQGPVGSAAGTGIIEFAQANKIDLIAMSTHGRSGLSRLIFGSVAEQVVRGAGLPVLLFRPKGHTSERLD